MSLSELIKFRDLADQLLQRETKQFLHNFTERHPPLILSALFVHFQKYPESSQPVIDDIKRCISSIIEKRDEDEDDDMKRLDKGYSSSPICCPCSPIPIFFC